LGFGKSPPRNKGTNQTVELKTENTHPPQKNKKTKKATTTTTTNLKSYDFVCSYLLVGGDGLNREPDIFFWSVINLDEKLD